MSPQPATSEFDDLQVSQLMRISEMRAAAAEAWNYVRGRVLARNHHISHPWWRVAPL